MKRVGYDADSGRYYFRDSDGALWEGAEGVEFGEMRRGMRAVFSLSPHILVPLLLVDALPDSIAGEADDTEDRRADDLEASPRTRNGGYQLLSDDQVSSYHHNSA